MNQDLIIEKLKGIYATVFENPGIEITPELNATMVDKWDSLSHLTMIAEVEEQFGIKFKLKELVSLKNTGDLIQLIATKIT